MQVLRLLAHLVASIIWPSPSQRCTSTNHTHHVSVHESCRRRGVGLARWLVPAVVLPAAALLADAFLSARLSRTKGEAFARATTYKRAAELAATIARDRSLANEFVAAADAQVDVRDVKDLQLFGLKGDQTDAPMSLDMRGACDGSNGLAVIAGAGVAALPQLAPGSGPLTVAAVLAHQRSLRTMQTGGASGPAGAGNAAGGK